MIFLILQKQIKIFLLNKLNIIFPKIVYKRIPFEIIDDLINNNKITFFKNKTKKVEIYDEIEESLMIFL